MEGKREIAFSRARYLGSAGVAFAISLLLFLFILGLAEQRDTLDRFSTAQNIVDDRVKEILSDLALLSKIPNVERAIHENLIQDAESVLNQSILNHSDLREISLWDFDGKLVGTNSATFTGMYIGQNRSTKPPPNASDLLEYFSETIGNISVSLQGPEQNRLLEIRKPVLFDDSRIGSVGIIFKLTQSVQNTLEQLGIAGKVAWAAKLNPPTDKEKILVVFTTALKAAAFFPGIAGLSLSIFSAFLVAALTLLGHYAFDTKVTQKNREAEALAQQALLVAHDIRSPLTTLQILKNDLNSPKSIQFLMDRAIQRINDIAHELLANQKRGLPYSSPPQRQDLASLVSNLTEEKKTEYSKKPGVVISCSVDDAARNTLIDFPSDEMARILSNLINNGVEALAEDGSVCTSVEAGHGRIVIRVADNGLGMDQGDLDKLLAGTLGSKKGGNGLGIASAKSRIENHGGSFDIASTRNTGTQVTISLPQKFIGH